jgi:hypothetical protein
MTKLGGPVVAILICLLFLPFLNQAFHIDDRIYLEIADNILLRPLRPYDYPPVFEGLVSPDAASHSHLPLTSYYLAPLRLVAGPDREWVYHLAFLVFPLLAAVGMYDLARRFVTHRAAAAALLVSSPSVVVLGHTLMPDVPLLAFWVLALSRFLRVAEGSNRPRDRVILLASLLAAGFISLLTLGLVLLMGAWLFLTRREGRPADRFPYLAPAAPLLLWVAWYFLAYLHYDRFVLVNTALHMVQREIFDWSLLGGKLLSFALNSGALFVVPLALWYGFAGKFRTRVALLVFFCAFAPLQLWVEGWTWTQTLLFALFLSSGFLVVWEFVLLVREKNPGDRLLALWFFGILAAALILVYAGSARYTLLALPPVILAWLRRLEGRIGEPYFLRNLVWTGVVLTAAWALPPAVADYRFAETYRRAAAELAAEYSAPDHTLWFAGEWGFRYYLERHGARLITRTEPGARPGDIIVKPFIASPWVTVFDGEPHTSLVEQRHVDEPFPVRILDFSSRAGFYSTGWGLLPFSLDSGEPWEWFNVFRVERPYEGPPLEEERHW